MVTGLLQIVDIGRGDAKWLVHRVVDNGSAKISADIKKVILDAQEQCANLGRDVGGGQHYPDGAVGLVDIGIGLKAWIVLAGATHIAQCGGAVITGARIDFGQINHGGSFA